MLAAIRDVFIVILFGFFTVASAQLPPEIMADAYLLQVERAIRDADLPRAQAAIKNIRSLQEQHELDLADEFHFRYAKAAGSIDMPEQALESVVTYLAAAGREGQHYVEALELMNKAYAGLSRDVESAQLSPDIMADAYLLQAERAIHDGDIARAKTAIQDIRSLREQNELDLPHEFHFRYAQAADSVDLPEQALESVVKYLTVSGREGQHYVEALELMNRAQMAVSCKGWDTEEYFKTATVEEVTACLDAGVDLKAKDDSGVTPLHRAVKNTEDPAVVEVLLKAGANMDALDKNSSTPLHFAAENENPAVIGVLLTQGADLNAKTVDNRTPLHNAATNKKPAVIMVLLDAGADLKATDKNGSTPLHNAATNENPAVVKALIDVGADVKDRNKNGSTSLHTAAGFSESPDVIAVLLAAGADLKATDKNGSTPLHYATKHNQNPDVIAVLLAAGADPKATDINKSTPLHLAAKNTENSAVVEMLLNAGADLKARDKDKWMPLHYAAENRNPSVTKLLLDTGANLKKRADNGLMPLHIAAGFNYNPDVIEVLLDAGANLKKRTDNGFTPLHWAAGYNENPAVIEMLLAAGADPKATDKTFLSRGRIPYLWTPLHVAARNNENPDVARVLLDAGADPNRQSLHGTPLHLAAVNAGSPAVLRVLIDAGADIESKSKGFGKHQRPLHEAAKYNENLTVLKFLLDAGADLNATDKDRSTPLHYAAEHNQNPAVAKALLAAGADLEARNKEGFTPLDMANAENKSPGVARVLIDAGATPTKTERKSQQGTDWGKVAIGVLGGAAIAAAGKDAPPEVTEDALAEWMNVLSSGQPATNEEITSGASPSQTQGGQSQDPMQQALQNLENVCGEKYRSGFAANDHYRFYCLAAFNDYCALKRTQDEEARRKLRASLTQNCAVLKGIGAESKCSYCE